MTNKEIYLKTIRAAQNLTKFGIVKGDVIAFVARNHHNLAPVIFAALTLAAPTNALDPSFKKGLLKNIVQVSYTKSKVITILFTDEIVPMFKLTKPKIVFCGSDNICVVQESLNELQLPIPIFIFDGKVDGSRSVEDLFTETGIEHQFM